MKRASKTPTDREKLLADVVTMTHAEARFLVSSYYASQEMRKRLDMQIRHAVGEVASARESTVRGERAVGDESTVRPERAAADESTEATERPIPLMLSFASDRFAAIERDMAAALKAYAGRSLVGQWCMSHIGIGPVITAGLLAHLDIEKAPTAGHFWSFAGLNPQMKWEKGQKRPYNAALKQVCFHLGECVKRTSNRDDSFYGDLYRRRKAFLVERNEAGYNAERAKGFRTNSATVKKSLALGRLPAGNLDRQACNYVAKMFLSHLHAVMFWDRYQMLPPKPFVIEHGGHVHLVKPPGIAEFFPDMAAAYEQRRAA